MTRTPIRLLVLLAASFTAIALAVPAQAAAPYCGITWGSLAKQAARRRCATAAQSSPTSGPASTPATTGWSSTSPAARASASYDVRVRAGCHGRTRRRRRSRCAAARSCRSPSAPTTTTATPTTAGQPRELVNVTGFRTFRQVAAAGSFEG